MTSINDGAPLGQSPSLAASSSPARLPRTRDNADLQSPASSVSSLPHRPNAAASVLFAATTPPGSRPLSPSAGITTPKIPSGSIFGGGTPHGGAPHDRPTGNGDDPRPLIAHAFVPHIAIFPSQDTDDLIGEKGFSRGLWQLLRPFGDRVQGKVIIRDSIGASRVCEDFSVRFIQLGSGYERPILSESLKSSTAQISTQNEQHLTEDQFTATGGNIEAVENVVDLHLEYAEHFPGAGYQEHLAGRSLPSSESELSPFYSLYLRRLLSGMPLAPHETFSHPVACIIAISSRNPNPIEELRRLYEEATRGEKRLPSWVNGEYLRYYVLVHDEERDDIGKAMSLFDQMKRHFGLHCHLLRLRSSRCVATDDDSVPLPTCEWLSASEELLDIQTREDQDGLDIAPPCIFESDATAITTFIREMVTQSVVPSMERCVSTWNDQVASRRRGISGRFMSLSKKWTVFGNGSKTSSGGPGTGGSGNNYDSLHGFYQPDTPESIMRKLADYAFMLRDWKLAQSVYELLRSDFNNDKAWRYYAAASEMAAVSTLLASQAMSSKVRIESVDQMLEASCYSYLTRCNSPYGALRCLTLSMELLKIRGESASEAAAKWGTKIIESNILGATGDAVMKERVATCYRSRKGTGSGGWGSRSRKSALWDILAADKWLILGKYVQARKSLGRVRNVYDISPNKKGISGFVAANEFLVGLEQDLRRASLSGEDQNAQGVSGDIETETFEGSETLDARTHRNSLLGATIPTMGSLETAPLHMVQEDIGGKGVEEDKFS